MIEETGNTYHISACTKSTSNCASDPLSLQSPVVVNLALRLQPNPKFPPPLLNPLNLSLLIRDLPIFIEPRKSFIPPANISFSRWIRGGR
jgi:hypothetical protein